MLLCSGADCESGELAIFEAHALGQDYTEAIEECGLGGVWLGDAAQPDLAVRRGRHDDVVGLNARQFLEESPRRVSEACTLLPHLKAFPQHESEEANENMSLNPVFALMPDRTDVQLILLDAESGLDIP